MTFSELANKRASCRKYSDKKVTDEQITDILKIAMLAPSACNSQPWKFIAATGEKASLIPPHLQHLGFNKFTSDVSSFIVICETKAVLMSALDGKVESQRFAQMDIGLATAHIIFAAEDMGLATCILGAIDEPKIKEILEIPEDINVALVIALGYSNSEARAKSRESFDEMVSFNKWN
ncbi:MAG: nitroreductase family protein [Defluviitaleaceae bacterium]|nr:nitroreductase family protein [Defluviitaleaceae bacterium]